MSTDTADWNTNMNIDPNNGIGNAIAGVGVDVDVDVRVTDGGVDHDGGVSSDLFGGDLFGDELLDMYNSVDLPISTTTGDAVNVSNHSSESGVGAMTSMDYLPTSNSFNDFTSILENSNSVLPSPTKIVNIDQVAGAGASGISIEENLCMPSMNLDMNMNSLTARAHEPTPVSVSSGSIPTVVAVNHSNKAASTVTTTTTVTNSGKKRSLSTTASNTGTSGAPSSKKRSPAGLKTSSVSAATHRRGPIKSDATAAVVSVAGSVSSGNTLILPPVTLTQHPAASASAVNAAVAASTVQVTRHPASSASVVNMNRAIVATSAHAQPTVTHTMAGTTITTAGNHMLTTANAAKVVQVPTSAASTVSVSSHAIARAVSHAASSADSVAGGASVNSAKTEQSFKGVAQAAVTNLIMSAGNSAGGSHKEDRSNSASAGVAGTLGGDSLSSAAGKNINVDTSTAHVAALTSNNWVAACAASVNISGAPAGTPQAAQAAALAAASDPAAAKAARARRATLTADERARQNRDRNREHARNTRLRKKAYVEELKRTLTELVTQRDATDLERRHEKQRDLEVREVRYRVMEEFLKLRARGSEQNLLARWIAILEDGFTLTLPKTSYRVMVPTMQDEEQHASQISSLVQTKPMARRVSTEDASSIMDSNSHKQILNGASQCFDDASKVATFMSSLLDGSATDIVTASVPGGAPAQMSYHCERTNFMMDGVKAVLDWTLKVSPPATSNVAASAAATSTPLHTIVFKGCMRATFSPASNKLACAELIFDTGNVISQVKAIKMELQQQVTNPISVPVSIPSVCPIAETDALLDSVLPQVPSMSPSASPPPAAPSNTNNTTSQNAPSDATVPLPLPSSVSVVSTDKDSSYEEVSGAIATSNSTAVVTIKAEPEPQTQPQSA
mmetsp:Transcript_22676/g.34589  ORF Transcript_22676/g.34589 Transcript_22676/m.34589 type:complete len:905 (+) Transcript_22676:568-3282(+)|eukprot:CAMPEP_0194085690 /NCGR_PEP_ID=MMETSP0149-20130528/18423_1 /TAXON_ID=122233 /ORGANISM="Chaetoceros debilis, Strain MM31A-1" /LENGTH=904 /DNA_ID=CAMNT_0038768633 /DNA_START=551 /DNA_END=3265 /DNA_ORIENTATION=+